MLVYQSGVVWGIEYELEVRKSSWECDAWNSDEGVVTIISNDKVQVMAPEPSGLGSMQDKLTVVKEMEMPKYGKAFHSLRQVKL